MLMSLKCIRQLHVTAAVAGRCHPDRARSVLESQAPAGLQRHIPKGSFLWEQIHPKDKDGLPARSPSGKYHVRCFVLDKWRRVTVDDRIPVDLFGRPLPVGIIPLQLWPLLLSKAVLKLMAAYQARFE